MSLESSDFTSNQITFIKVLAGATGLNAGVVAAWALCEMSAGAAEQFQASNYNDWLNIGWEGPGSENRAKISYDAAWNDPTTAAQKTAAWMEGKWGQQYSYVASAQQQTIIASASAPAATQIRTLQTSQWSGSGYPSLPGYFEQLDPQFVQQLQSGATLSGGGVWGLSGTGTSANDTVDSLWTVGDSSNPDQDYWTTINQYAQDAQWYVISDAETLYVADGYRLMAQRPQAIICRYDPAVLPQSEVTYDNSSFNYTASHVKKQSIVRRAALAKVVSPTQVTIRIICDIDMFRAGDTVYLSCFGPADGIWLVGECQRSIFQPYSELTLVQAMMPVNASSGTALGPLYETGSGTVKAASGTVMAAMIAEADALDQDDYPYVWGGGHGAAGTPSIGTPGTGYNGHTKGFDCSGSVAAVLAAGGLWQWGAPVGGDQSIPAQLLSEDKAVRGPAGTAAPMCTIYNLPGQHIFLRMSNQSGKPEYWGTVDGSGNMPDTPNGGPGWIPNGVEPGPEYLRYHIPASILGQQAAGTVTTTS